VIKRLRPELIADPGAVSQFCDEANLLAALHHPNIVAVHDFGRAQNQYFLAEEYVAGRNLGRILERRLATTRRPLPVEIIAHVGCEILKALEYAHGLRDGDGRPLAIVHRDVSPENVMVSALGEVKLLDFGVVKAEGRLTKTETGVVKGNVTYMAPEQARGLEVDARADLYSLALVLYFCCAGRPLYAADTTYGLLMKAGAGPGIEERARSRRWSSARPPSASRSVTAARVRWRSTSRPGPAPA
jgi:serine/threonine-protein kinase